jgi:hypothetical protein
MSRPRFLTALAVSAAVCDGLEDRLATDNITPSYLVFEWYVVEAFIRAGNRSLTKNTPGTLKAQTARDAGDALSARTYLRVPTVFGFHGVYKPLARNLGIVDDQLQLADNGYELLRIWQTEQGLDGFLEASTGGGRGQSMRQMLRAAVEDALQHGCTRRSGAWQGWSLLASHLAPGAIRAKEAGFLLSLLTGAGTPLRREVFQRLAGSRRNEDESERAVVLSRVLPHASAELVAWLNALNSYEAVCTALEEAFNWIRHLSTQAHARPILAAEFAAGSRPEQLAAELPSRIAAAESRLAIAPLSIQQEFAELTKPFMTVRDAATLFDAVLSHHAAIQRAKKPDGKREWFERSPAGATFVRVPYRVPDTPDDSGEWNRPYRFSTVQSFVGDLEAATP